MFCNSRRFGPFAELLFISGEGLSRIVKVLHNSIVNGHVDWTQI